MVFFYENDTKQVYNQKNMLQNLTECTIDIHSDEILGYMDIINRVILPSSFMTIFSFLMMYTVFSSRFRVNNKNYKSLKRDIRLAVSLILINMLYVFSSLPVSVVFLFENFLDEYYLNLLSFIAFYLLVICYSSNFYIIILTNSLFRNECSILLKRKILFIAFNFIICFMLSVSNYLKVDISF